MEIKTYILMAVALLADFIMWRFFKPYSNKTVMVPLIMPICVYAEKIMRIIFFAGFILLLATLQSNQIQQEVLLAEFMILGVRDILLFIANRILEDAKREQL